MPRDETILTIFVSSPQDVEAERDVLARVVAELNDTWSRQFGIRLDLLRWETSGYPGIGDDAQDVLNQELPDDYDIFVGIMWTRYGTPTSRAGSGTEEEFERAHARYIADTDSVRIMFYFKTQAVSPDDVVPEQLERRNKFKAKLGQLGGLWWVFDNTNQFETQVRQHLSRILQNFHKYHKVGPQADTSKSDEDSAVSKIYPPSDSAQLQAPLAEPQSPPHYLTGTVEIGGGAAPDGTTISAWMHGMMIPGAETQVFNGQYAILVPQTVRSEGLPIEFKIGGLNANETHAWELGGVDLLNLTTQSTGRVPPHVFVGVAAINDLAAPEGTPIYAIVKGIPAGQTKVINGGYSLLVDQGDHSFAGEIVDFYIGSLKAEEWIIWMQGGGDVINLTAKDDR